MAVQEIAPWTVLIIAEEQRFNRNYQFTPDTTLAEVMNTWVEGCGQPGYWVFTSADRGDRCRYFDFMTLEMVGESTVNSGIVNLRVKSMDETDPRPTSEIFGLANDQCHYIEVEPELHLDEVLRCLPGRPRALEHNGVLLNLEETVEDAGLLNNDVVQECRRQINVDVKLSSGVTRTFQVAEDSFVLHLYETVKMLETEEDFSLVHRGRCLHMQERVRDLRQVVEVARAQFLVDINGRHVTWTTRSEPITFSNFLSQLSLRGELDIEELEMLDFSCVGCQRCVSKSEEDQKLPIECCREKSLTLTTKPHSNTRTQDDIREVLKSIQSLIEYVNRKETDPRAKVSRNIFDQVQSSLEESGINYNTYMAFVEKMKKHLNELEDTINATKTESESLKAKNATSEEKAMTLKAKNVDLEAKAETFQKVVRCLHENTGGKLRVFYNAGKFSPVVSRPEILQQGKYPWATKSHVKCVIPELQAGWAPFEAVRDALQPLFSDAIREIRQIIGAVEGRDVVEVTTRADDEVRGEMEDIEFCDENGRQVSWEEAGKPRQALKIREGGRVLISGGQRRTVLSI